MPDSDLILHHYPQSPVSEKVRIVLGLKDLDWRSVTIPRLPPKPDLVALTGGYRLTPVLQIGADVYCDTQRIIMEIERRHPTPALFPGGADGLAWLLARWTDGPLFKQTVAVVFGDAGEAMPADFQADRVPLYFGAETTVADLIRRLPENLAQLRAQLAWMDQRVANRDFMLGPEPGLPDVLCYYIVWLVRGRYSKGPEFLAEFGNLTAWEDRVKAHGHGRPVDLDATDALSIARDASPGSPDPARARPDPLDPLGLAPGQAVSVAPDGVDAAICPPVTGFVTEACVHTVALGRNDAQIGDVVVHFPRVGTRIERVQPVST